VALGDDPSPVDVAEHLADRLDEEELPYAFGGAIALGVWGVPRTTQDVDVAIFATDGELDKVLTGFERAGAIVDRGAATRSVTSAGFFVADLGGTRVDAFMAHHPWHVDMQTRRVSLVAPSGRPRWFLSAEDIAVAKLIYNRSKDVADLERLWDVQGAQLDTAYIQRWLQAIVPAEDRRHQVLAELLSRR
jgi:hypothetical protein